MEIEKPRNVVRPFFIAAQQLVGKQLRPCSVSSESVAAIRPLYEDEKPSATETKIIKGSGSEDLRVRAPYPVVAAIFARHGYEFIEEDALHEETAAYYKQNPKVRSAALISADQPVDKPARTSFLSRFIPG